MFFSKIETKSTKCKWKHPEVDWRLKKLLNPIGSKEKTFSNSSKAAGEFPS